MPKNKDMGENEGSSEIMLFLSDESS